VAQWFEVTVEVPEQYGEAIANFLIEGGAPGVQIDERGEITVVTACFPQMPPLEPLRRYYTDLTADAQDIAARVRHIGDEDWAHSWKAHFVAQAIGRRLYVCTPWECHVPPGRLAVVIEPGMALGTGRHATTRGCLELLEAATDTRRITRALDIGTGSGILGIALAKLGVPVVWAVDTDPTACAIAAANVSVNGTQEAVHVTADLDAAPGPFDLIVANLFAKVLMQLAPALAARVRQEGLLICSGLLADDEPELLRTYESLGFTPVARRAEAEWVTLGLQQKPV